MTEFSWSVMRNRITELFGGELAAAQYEADIVEIFKESPHGVMKAAEDIARGVSAGRIDSGWAVLRKHLVTAASASDITVTDTSEREKAIRKAERFLHNAGCYYDRESEVLEALFGPNGFDGRGTSLAPWASDNPLRNRMVALWEKERPRGERSEREELERAESWVRNRERIRQLASKAAVRSMPE